MAIGSFISVMVSKPFKFNSLRFTVILAIALSVFGGIRLWMTLLGTEQFDLIGISAITASLVLFSHIVGLYIPRVRGIPVIPPDSIFGFSSALYPLDNANNHEKMLEVANKYGKLAQFQFFGKTVVAINDKKMAKNALKNVTGKGNILRGNPRINHPSIFNLDTNDAWLLRRNLFRGAFSANQLKTQSDIIASLCLKLISKLELYADAGKSVQIDKLFGQLTMDVICNVAFQMDMNALGNSEEFELLHESLRVQFESNIIASLPFAQYLMYLPLPAFARYRRATYASTTFAKKILSHIRQLHDQGTLKSNSIGQAIINLSNTDGITEEDLIAEINVIFVAGHETTAHTLSWFIYTLATHPTILAKAQQEMDVASFRETKKIVLSPELPPYVEAVLKESMRRYPVAPFGSFRKVKEAGYHIDDGENSYHVKKSQWILVNLYILHNCDGNWGSDALDIIPERWLSAKESESLNTINRDSKLNPTTANPLASPAVYSGGGATKDDLMFAPFSYGPRNCIGMNLALLEMKLMISELIEKFTFKLANNTMHDESKAMESYLTLRPHDKLPVYVYSRLKEE